MRFVVLATAVALSVGLAQLPAQTQALSMAGVEACQVEFSNGATTGRWGGRIAIYEEFGRSRSDETLAYFDFVSQWRAQSVKK
jgi:hypothetical protein